MNVHEVARSRLATFHVPGGVARRQDAGALTKTDDKKFDSPGTRRTSGLRMRRKRGPRTLSISRIGHVVFGMRIASL